MGAMFLEDCGFLARERVDLASRAPSLVLIGFGFNKGDCEESVLVPIGQKFNFFCLRSTLLA